MSKTSYVKPAWLSACERSQLVKGRFNYLRSGGYGDRGPGSLPPTSQSRKPDLTCRNWENHEFDQRVLVVMDDGPARNP